MLSKLKGIFFGQRALKISPMKSGAGWLSSNLPGSFDPATIDISAVRARAEQTSRLGERPLWHGYQDVKDYPFATTGNRTSDQVRTSEDLGALYAWLVSKRKPDIIVEFGTAFGISGMFWLTGLKLAGKGTLFTYEPNEIWSAIAEENLKSISSQFVLTKGIFEEFAAGTLSEKSVDIAFVDAIHTSEFVYAQYEKLMPYLKDNALVLFDDIAFSPDMADCWSHLAERPEVLASYQLGNRVGIVELQLNRG
jgi:predicted O-methyltransferase YrrM